MFRGEEHWSGKIAAAAALGGAGLSLIFGLVVRALQITGASLADETLFTGNLWLEAVVLLAASEVLARPLSAIFVNYDAGLLELTVHGFRIYSLAFLIMGINVWGSSFFTALNNGLVSAVISFLRTLVFQIVVISVLPLWFGVDGIWFSVVAAEGMALFVTLGFLFTNRRRYHY